MSGLTDLTEILASLRVSVRPDRYTYLTTTNDLDEALPVAALVEETEGTTAVVTVDDARRIGLPVHHELAWLTLEVHSSLEAVGLTAAVADALAAEGIPCNVLAGYYHDHLLVPVDSAARAATAVEALRD